MSSSLQPTRRRIVLVLVSLIVCLYSSITSAAPTKLTDGTLPDLVQLTAANWSTQIAQGSWLIEFYSPYCTPCKTFLPLWAQLVKNKATLANDDPHAPFRLAQVNCHAQGDLCMQEGVPHFPRLSLYKDGKRAQSEYQGNREYTEIAAWIDQEVQEYRQGIHSSDVKGAIAPDKQIILQEPSPDTLGPSPASSPKVASQPYSLAKEADTDSASLLAVTTAQDVLPPQSATPPSSSAESAQADRPAPPLPHSPPSAPSQPPVDLHLPNPYGHLLKFGATPGLTTLQELRDWLGASIEDTQSPLPPIRAEGATTIANDIKSANAQEGQLGTGATDAAKGNGGAHLSSATAATALPPLPPTRLPANRKLTPARGGTFVKFFAPWCPHCKAMAQSFEKIAAPLRNKLNVLEVDCEAHKDVCKAFRVRSYPTLRLYSPVNDLVSEYRGSRTADAMLSWCEKAAEEEVVDLVEVNDMGHWLDTSRQEEVRFLWIVEGGVTDGHDRPAGLEEEQSLVTLASRTLFTSPYRVYRTSSPQLISQFQPMLSPWKGTQSTGGLYRSVLLAFRDHDALTPVSNYVLPTSFNATSQRTLVSQWLDWTRYPTLSQVGGDAWVDVMNNVHSAPVVLGLLSSEHHNGETYGLGRGELQRRGELAALKRMALAWRDSKLVFNKTLPRSIDASGDSPDAIKYTSSGGLLWAWIDADRHRTAIKKFYKLSKPLQQSLPALLLVDTEAMSYWELPTLKPSKLVDVSALETSEGKDIAMKSRSKTSYTGESREISTWLGEGALSHGKAGSSDPVAAGTVSFPATSRGFVDDIGLLPFVVSISRGEQGRGRRSNRSYVDRGTTAIVDFASRHWIVSLAILALLIFALIRYVRDVQDEQGRGVRSGGYRTLMGRKKD